MRTKAYRKKLMADLKSAIKNCKESVEKTYAPENKKKLLASVIIVLIIYVSCIFVYHFYIYFFLRLMQKILFHNFTLMHSTLRVR